MPTFRATIYGFPDSIVSAQTSSKARHVVVSSAREVGYMIDYKDVSVRRAPEYDNATCANRPLEPGKAYGEWMLVAPPISPAPAPR